MRRTRISRATRSSLLGAPVASLLLASLVVISLSAVVAVSARAVPDVAFPDGVGSGDVTATSAVLWTRVDQALPLKIEVSTSPSFSGPEAFKQTVHPSTGDDLTVKALATPLEPGTTYYFRWRHGSAISPVGSFVTAPASDDPADVRFAYTADSDGLQQMFFGNDFPVLDAVRAEGADFWVYLGDTIYSDSSLRDDAGLSPAAVTLDEYRDVYKLNRSIDALPDLMQSTSTLAIWDDHEVHNDYAGQTVDPARYANGRKAFVEYMPLLEMNLLEDATCAGDPLFRIFHWGSEVDVIVLDERSCRSTQATASCQIAPGVADLAPTLPPPIRAAFAPLLPLNPPPGCVDAIFDPSRTMLGPVQKAAFKAALLASTAKFKFVINEVPIQQFYALPYDRWEGYGAERNELLAFIRDNGIENVVFLTTDMHANLISNVAIDRFVAPAPISQEFVTGPIATFTFQEEIASFAAGLGLPPAQVIGAFHQVLNIVGVLCRNIDRDAYGLVEVDASAGTATLSFKDENGALVTNSNPLAPGDVHACTTTLGP
jgi:phosphodiesterase/alkaline phosphatase D-like protein